MSNYILINGTLYHHGIKGQKWGNRRFQNEDGSLTPAGREHYGYGEAIRKTVSSGLKKIVGKTIENKVKDSQIQMQKDRMKRDPNYRRKIERENEFAELKRRREEKDPFGLKGKINNLGKTDKQKEREEYDRRQALKNAKQKKYKEIGKAALTGAVLGVAAAKIYQAGKVSQAYKDAVAVGRNVSKAISIEELKNMGIEVFKYEKFKY